MIARILEIRPVETITFPDGRETKKCSILLQCGTNQYYAKAFGKTAEDVSVMKVGAIVAAKLDHTTKLWKRNDGTTDYSNEVTIVKMANL